MTFDDGILSVYSVVNVAEPGRKPIEALKEKAKYYYGFDRIGVTRYYTAKQYNQNIEAVINVPDWIDATTDNVIILEEFPDIQYQIHMVQPEYDENGLKITKLTLGRVGHEFKIN